MSSILSAAEKKAFYKKLERQAATPASYSIDKDFSRWGGKEPEPCPGCLDGVEDCSCPSCDDCGRNAMYCDCDSWDDYYGLPHGLGNKRVIDDFFADWLRAPTSETQKSKRAAKESKGKTKGKTKKSKRAAKETKKGSSKRVRV